MRSFYLQGVREINSVFFIPMSWTGKRFTRWQKKYKKAVNKLPLKRTKFKPLKRTR